MIEVYNYTQHYVQIPVEFLTFPAGERHVSADIDFVSGRDVIVFKVRFSSSDDIIDLMLLNDVFRNYTRQLDLCYIPFSRQDRAVNPGEAHSLRVFCDLAKSMNFQRISISDPHSDVVEALLPNAVIYRQWDIAITMIRHQRQKFDYVIAPDAGASKKAGKLAEKLGIPMLQASKKRDLKTGKIDGYELLDKVDLCGKSVLVADDLIDGGGTFIALAKAIDDPTCKKTLYVTHGIFSRGKALIREYYDDIICYNDMSKEI